MQFLIGSRRMFVLDRHGLRIHRAPVGSHFEPAILKGQHEVMLLKPDSITQSPEQLNAEFREAVAQQAVNDALLFHRDRTEELLKRVLNAETAADAASLVNTELEVTEERIIERAKQ